MKQLPLSALIRRERPPRAPNHARYSYLITVGELPFAWAEGVMAAVQIWTGLRSRYGNNTEHALYRVTTTGDMLTTKHVFERVG